MTKDENKEVLEIIDTMLDLHSIKRDKPIIELSDLIKIYEECIDSCPKVANLVLKNLESDLLRINEYNHQLPDLLSSITWSKISVEYKESLKNADEE